MRWKTYSEERKQLLRGIIVLSKNIIIANGMTLFHFSPDLTDVLVEMSLDFFSYIWGGSFHRLKMFFFLLFEI